MSYAIKKTMDVPVEILHNETLRAEAFRRLFGHVSDGVRDFLLPNIGSDRECVIEVQVRSGSPSSWDLTIVHAVTDVSLSAARGAQVWTVVECMGDDCSACANRVPRALLEQRNAS